MAIKSEPSRKNGQTVRDRITGLLRDDILMGVFVPGQRLSEAELCAHLGSSRPSVREALRQLEAERLIEIQPYRGPSVARLDWEDAAQIYDVRALIEPEAVRLFAATATPAQLAAMREALSQFDAGIENGLDQSLLIRSTTAFYDVILEGCGNAILVEILRGLRARINLLRTRSMSHAGRPRESLAEMTRIWSTISDGNTEAAQQAARDHILKARANARKAMCGPQASRV